METKILEIKPETPTITHVVLEKPAGFTFQPGQFLNVEIPVENCDNRCNKRNFSIASSPSDPHLLIATRHGVSRFKQTIVPLPIGTPVKLMGPFGHFVLNEDPNIPAVMLSGGIGITPLYSMIKYATQKKLAKQITLIYSNSNVDDIPFKIHLDEIDEANEHLIIYHTVTNEVPVHELANWTGLTGRIDEAMVRKLVLDINAVEYYICGPGAMVAAMRELLKTMNISPAKIKFEAFVGY